MRTLSRPLKSAMALVVAGSLAFAVAASAGSRNGTSSRHDDDGPDRALRANLIASLAAGPTINGVRPGGRDWSLRTGTGTIDRDGSITVKVRGLVFTETGTTTPPNGNPLAAVSASLFCNGSTVAVGTTPSAPLSSDGNARIGGTLTLPSACNAPVVAVHPGTNVGVYIAISGFGM